MLNLGILHLTSKTESSRSLCAELPKNFCRDASPIFPHFLWWLSDSDMAALVTQPPQKKKSSISVHLFVSGSLERAVEYLGGWFHWLWTTSDPISSKQLMLIPWAQGWPRNQGQLQSISTQFRAGPRTMAWALSQKWTHPWSEKMCSSDSKSTCHPVQNHPTWHNKGCTYPSFPGVEFFPWNHMKPMMLWGNDHPMFIPVGPMFLEQRCPTPIFDEPIGSQPEVAGDPDRL